ncbi:hypothetical protein [Aeromonas rivipollensis]|uniref:hypothetical protein n=1 Tax=Aeromonas rivipollensis TaxID=948519 RepID=UPI0038CF50EC
MANINDVKAIVKEYEINYRHPKLDPFIYLDEFDLMNDNPACPAEAEKKGVYVIFNGDDIIYIGKSSSQNKGIWHRIVDHIYSSRKSNWASEATHFVAWAVPDDSFFEASALEEFLIFKMKNNLPYNTVGK